MTLWNRRCPGTSLVPRTCTICKHPSREEINAALITGESFRNIAKRFETSTTALFRHKKADLPATLVKSAEIAEVVEADTLVGRLQSLHTETMAILREARSEGTKDNALALKAIGRAEKQLELGARLLGELPQHSKADVQANVGVQVLVYAPKQVEESSFGTIEVE